MRLPSIECQAQGVRRGLAIAADGTGGTLRKAKHQWRRMARYDLIQRGEEKRYPATYMKLTIHSAIAAFGAKAKEKLSNPAASGQPEDQLRAPFEHLPSDLAELSMLPRPAASGVTSKAASWGHFKTGQLQTIIQDNNFFYLAGCCSGKSSLTQPRYSRSDLRCSVG